MEKIVERKSKKHESFEAKLSWLRNVSSNFKFKFERGRGEEERRGMKKLMKCIIQQQSRKFLRLLV